MTDAPPCTLIVARPGAPDPAQDGALLRAAERELGLPTGALAASAHLQRPEFRLVEGIPRATAERLAVAAERLGYTPRIRDGVDIKWSSERGLLPLAGIAGLMVAAYAVFTAVATAVGVFLDAPMLSALLPSVGLPVFGVVMAVVISRWYRAIFLPLVVTRAMLPAHEADPAVEAAAVDARAALERLDQAIRTEDLPEVARADLAVTHRQLQDQVTAVARRAPPALPASSAVSALRARLDALTDGASEERARLEEALAAEAASAAARDAQRSHALADLLGVRLAADAAVATLRANAAGDATADLQRQVAALGKDGDPVRREAALRARQPARQG